MTVEPIPEGFHTVTPYLLLHDIEGFLGFITKAFGAEVMQRHDTPDGKVMHAQIAVGDSPIMMGDPGPMGVMPGGLYLYVNDVDEVYARAIAAGAESIGEPADQFYGDRQGGVKDSWGNTWWIATRIEDVSSEELARRAAEAMQKRDAP